MQVINTLFMRVFKQLEMAKMNCVGNQASFFSPQLAARLPKHKLEVWPGYALVVDRFESGVLIQCDLASKVSRAR